MKTYIIREPRLEEILESIKVFLLSFGRMNFNMILTEEKTWVYLINNKIAKFLIAETEEKIVGVGGLFLFQQVGSVGYMGVLPDYRGQGIGTAIFRNLMKIALSVGVKTVMLYASKLGEPIYKKFGFVGKYNASMHHLVNFKPEMQESIKDVKIIESAPDWVLKFDRKTMGFDRSDYLKARISVGAKLLLIENEGFGLLSPVLSKIRLGPLMAKNPEIALQIINKGIELGADNLIIPYYPLMQNKISMMSHLTESKEPPNLKMVYGKDIQGKLRYLYSIGTYARG
jgi:ribosomal-protein-alanine N-acetyltransferase